MSDLDTGSSVNGLRSVHFGVQDVGATVDFFTRVWGLSPAGSDRDVTYLRGTGSAPYLVALHRSERTEVLRVDLTARDEAAIDGLHARLAARGVAELTTPGAIAEWGGGYGLRFRDPENRLYLVLAGDTQLEALAQSSLPRKLSHVVLNSVDWDALRDFFTDALGFRLVDRTRRIQFLNCNSDHHSIALLEGSQSTLNHVAFEMDGFDNMMRGIGRLRDHGMDMGWGIGRHGPGNNIFAYFVGPEILPLEYTADVLQIDETYRVGTPDDWKPVPGRMDQWGITSAPSLAMKAAEQSIGFSQATL